MPRPARAFAAAPFELEGRLLLSAGPASTPEKPPIVRFVGDQSGTPRFPTQVVTQQAGEATVTLSRPDTAGPLQVEVATYGYTPYVGATDQTLTFADGQGQASLTVPILAGAPNPGVVDVPFFIKSINSTPIVNLAFAMMDLTIVASEPTLPPRVVSASNAPSGIVVRFNKPMNPVAASNVKNYFVQAATSQSTGFLGLSQSLSAHSVPLRSARYDPSTQSVTLIPKQPVRNDPLAANPIQGRRTKSLLRLVPPSNTGSGLTDLQGNLINPDTTPGIVGIRLTNPSYYGGGSL